MSKEDLMKRLAELNANKSSPAASPTTTQTPPISSISPTNQESSGGSAATSLRDKIAARNSGTVNMVEVPTNIPTENSLPTPDAIKNLLIVPKDSEKLEGFNPEEFVAILPQLKEALDKSAPGIASYLSKINENLNQYQELAHLLNDDQLAVITDGFFFLTDTDMASAVTRKGSKKVLTIDMVDKLF